jgi:hypothetical protein
MAKTRHTRSQRHPQQVRHNPKGHGSKLKDGDNGDVPNQCGHGTTRNKDLCVVQWSMPITQRSTMPLRDAKFACHKSSLACRVTASVSVRSRRQDWTSLPPQVYACCDFCERTAVGRKRPDRLSAVRVDGRPRFEDRNPSDWGRSRQPRLFQRRFAYIREPHLQFKPSVLLGCDGERHARVCGGGPAKYGSKTRRSAPKLPTSNLVIHRGTSGKRSGCHLHRAQGAKVTASERENVLLFTFDRYALPVRGSGSTKRRARRRRGEPQS